MNIVVLKGNLGRDPELKTFKKSDGSTGQLVNFTLAVRRDMGDDTDWFNCVAFGKRAEVIDKFFKKGSQILIAGRVEVSTYEKDGVKNKSQKIIVNEFDFLDKKDSGKTQQPEHDAFQDAEEDIPF